ncbi:hypothetical protein N9V74_07335 [Alteromonas sp.]|jgi:hypothetical protein|nr:hypothetical protein [Alteromonas sp.]
MNTEPVHGTYSLEKQQDLIICRYSDGFNLAGVKALINDILVLARDLDRWALYQKPDNSAGVVHNAIDEMMNGYVQFQNAGCVAVAIQENSIFVRAGTPYRPISLHMPIRIEKSEVELVTWLEQSLVTTQPASQVSA